MIEIIPPAMRGTISGADERLPRPPAPHHVTPIGAAQTMADPKSTSTPLVRRRNAKGTLLFEKRCPQCGAIAVVDRRKLGNLCSPCSNKARKTHGRSKDPLYGVWNGIIIRCTYPSATNYAYYGGRGITVCDEWKSPAAFFAWADAAGWKRGLEVDRIDPDGPYSPENCRLLDHRRNSQRTRRIKTTPEQVRAVVAELKAGASIKAAAKSSGVTYMVAWHIQNDPDVWRNER